MNSTQPPNLNCLYDKWSNICLSKIKKDIYSYFSYYSIDDLDCAFKNIDLEKNYKTPNDFYINSELFIINMKKILDKCKVKKKKRVKNILLNLFFIILFILLLISYFIRK